MIVYLVSFDDLLRKKLVIVVNKIRMKIETNRTSRGEIGSFRAGRSRDFLDFPSFPQWNSPGERY